MTVVPAASHEQARLDLLVRAGEIFHQSLDVTDTLNNVARTAVESFADICLFDLIDEQSARLFVTAAAHKDPAKQEALASVANILYIEEYGVHPVLQVTRTGKPFFVPRMDESTIREHAASRQHERYMREFGYRSKVVVPVTAQAHIFGALTFVRTQNDHPFDEADLKFAIELGRRAGVAVANAKQFHRERNVAETLQRAFLPNRFPAREGMDISAYYRPGSSEADIGGDWYDAFDMPGGEIVVTIGDITGKGVEAARLMVLLRQAIRVAALSSTNPRKIAKICNRLLLYGEEGKLASAFIGVLSPKSRRLQYVSAGHSPPYVRYGRGDVRPLEAPSPPLGALEDVDFEVHSVKLPPGAMLVLYTDGLIEVTRNVFAGQEMLERVIGSEALVHASSPAEFIERAIAYESPRDDIAILVVKFGNVEKRWQVEVADARAAYTMRDDFFRTLSEICTLTKEQISTCGLIFAELIGNAVRHAPGPVSVSLEMRGHDVLLHLIDKGPGFDYEPQLPPSVWTESGRGLFLVSILAREVIAERIPGLGTHIMVTLPVRCERS